MKQDSRYTLISMGTVILFAMTMHTLAKTDNYEMMLGLVALAAVICYLFYKHQVKTLRIQFAKLRQDFATDRGEVLPPEEPEIPTYLDKLAFFVDRFGLSTLFGFALLLCLYYGNLVVVGIAAAAFAISAIGEYNSYQQYLKLQQTRQERPS